MSTITKERLEQLANFRGAPVTRQEEQELARIALASLEAEPVAWLLSGGAKNNVSLDSGNAYADPLREVTPLYTAPPAPANAEPVAWLWSHRKHPSEVSLIRPEDDERAEGAHWSGWSCQALYAAPPAPVSVPAAMEMDDDFDSAFEHGKAVGWNACRAAMLQGAEQQNRQQNIPENIPATQFKPVADLYGLTSPTGGETSFTFDAVEARDFVDGGWSCQEYVELERFQEAVSGNSPVIQGCSCLTCRPVTFSDSRFVVCPECGNKRCPHANDHRNACTGSNEPGQDGSAYPAAPQQGVK